MPRSHRFAGTTSSQLIVGQAICFTIRVECVPPENMDSLRLVHEKQHVWVPVKKTSRTSLIKLTYLVFCYSMVQPNFPRNPVLFCYDPNPWVVSFRLRNGVRFHSWGWWMNSDEQCLVVHPHEKTFIGRVIFLRGWIPMEIHDVNIC